jgi:hypothetical protein
VKTFGGDRTKSKPRRLAALGMALLAAALLAGSGCGSDEERTSGLEGELVKVEDAVYLVQLTRLLNPLIRPDDQYLRGQVPPPREEQYLAIFLTIENEGSQGYRPPRGMKVVDSVGNEYLPLDATQSGFGLDFASDIAPGESAPPPGSPAAEGPNAAAMVLFRVRTESATDNLPLELEVPTGSKSSSKIELDV